MRERERDVKDLYQKLTEEEKMTLKEWEIETSIEQELIILFV